MRFLRGARVRSARSCGANLLCANRMKISTARGAHKKACRRLLMNHPDQGGPWTPGSPAAKVRQRNRLLLPPPGRRRDTCGQKLSPRGVRIMFPPWREPIKKRNDVNFVTAFIVKVRFAPLREPFCCGLFDLCMSNRRSRDRLTNGFPKGRALWCGNSQVRRSLTSYAALHAGAINV